MSLGENLDLMRHVLSRRMESAMIYGAGVCYDVHVSTMTLLRIDQRFQRDLEPLVARQIANGLDVRYADHLTIADRLAERVVDHYRVIDRVLRGEFRVWLHAQALTPIGGWIRRSPESLDATIEAQIAAP